jgi:quercetin dioxygenase-like cupin family protein
MSGETMKNRTNLFNRARALAAAFTLIAAGSTAAFAGEYPIPEREPGTTAFFHQDNAPRKANKSYPSWYRGHGENGLADKDAKYFYQELIGPSAWVKPGLNAERAYFGTLELAAGETYPAHNHPAPELYYVVEGEADWYVNDEKQHVTPGSVIYHRPYDVHGWVNTSQDKPLRVVWMWWAEKNPSVMNSGARFTNPDLFKTEESIMPHAVPVPAVRHSETSHDAQKYDGEHPVFGRVEGQSAFFHEAAAASKANKSYPAWFRGHAAKGLADEHSHYSYKELVGPERYITTGLNSEYFYFGTLELTAGKSYPAHNHPASEVYFVLEGEADWYVNDEKQHVTPGSIIYHRPFAAHGWTNTGATPLKVLWFWWPEDGDTSVFDKGARLINPELSDSPEKIKPYAIPLPATKGN